MYKVPAPITMAGASTALAAGTDAIEAGESEFSLAGLAGSDSSALAVLLSWQRRAARHNLKLRFVDVPAEMVQFATLYGIEDFLPGFPSSAFIASVASSSVPATKAADPSLPRH